MEPKKIFAIAVAAVLAVTVAGAAIVLGNQEAEAETLTIGIANKNGYDPLIYAYEAGLFADEGLSVEVKWDENGGKTTAALLAGQVDMTNAGTTPVINAIHRSSNIKMVACNCFDKPGKSSAVLVALKADIDDGTLDLGDLKKTFFDAEGNFNGKKIGMAYDSGYYSTWVKFVIWEGREEGLTDTQIAKLKTLNGEGGAIVDLTDAAVGVTNLLSASPTVDMVIGGSDIDKVSEYPALGYLVIPPEYYVDNAPVGGIYIVSEKAYREKKPQIEKALRAIKKSAAMINDVSEKGDGSEHYGKAWEYTEKHGAYANEATMLKNIQSRYWNMFLLSEVFQYYNEAEAADTEKHVDGFDLKDSFTDEFLRKIYGDEPYILNRKTGEWGSALE